MKRLVHNLFLKTPLLCYTNQNFHFSCCPRIDQSSAKVQKTCLTFLQTQKAVTFSEEYYDFSEKLVSFEFAPRSHSPPAIFFRLLDISTPNFFSTPNFNPWLFNHELFNPTHQLYIIYYAWKMRALYWHKIDGEVMPFELFSNLGGRIGSTS